MEIRRVIGEKDGKVVFRSGWMDKDSAKELTFKLQNESIYPSRTEGTFYHMSIGRFEV